MSLGVKNIDFGSNIIKNDRFLPFSWCVASDLDVTFESKVLTEILKSKSLICIESDFKTGKFSTIYDLQFKTYFIYDDFGIYMEPIFNQIDSRGEEGFTIVLNSKLSDLIKIHKDLDFVNSNVVLKDYLSKYLFFNFATLNKVSLTLKLSDIRKLLFMEEKYSSPGDLHNKVIKKLLSQLPIGLKCYAIPSSNGSINSFMFQRS